jgi:hypothetical protein
MYYSLLKMGKNTKPFQTKLKPTNRNGNAWNVVGKRKPIAESTLETELSNKKADQKMTPSREADTQLVTRDALTTPIPDSPVSDPEEANLIAAIKNSINSPPSTKVVSLDDKEFPPLSSKKISNKNISLLSIPKVMTIAAVAKATIHEDDAESTSSTKASVLSNSNFELTPFAATYPSVYPPDWSISPTNYYKQPSTEDMDAIDTLLMPENERRVSLCLSPFSREFFIATGYSKLQLPEDYLELVRVIVWHNRRRIKKGLSDISPAELEMFLRQELAQDFSDLGIDIDDFLADLIKIRHAEDIVFGTFNEFIKKETKKHNHKPITLPTLLESKPSPMKNNPDTAAILVEETNTQLPTANLLHKFAMVSDESQKFSQIGN